MISIIQIYCIFSIAQIGNQETHLGYGFLPYYGQVFIDGHFKRLIQPQTDECSFHDLWKIVKAMFYDQKYHYSVF